MERKESESKKISERHTEGLNSCAKDLLFTFTRKNGGYIDQIKRYLKIDFEKFDDSDIKNKQEKVKILYLPH